MQHITLSAIIDSTHFANGQSVDVTFWALTDELEEVEDTKSVVIKNSGFAWELPEFADLGSPYHASDDVQDLAGQAGWSMGESHAIAWTALAVKNNLNGSGVHYVNSHGAVGSHWADFSWQEPDPPGWATFHEHVFGSNANLPNASSLHMRREQVGDYDANPSLPAPPFNPSGVPWVAFAFIDSCHSGFDNSFAWILYPCRIYGYVPQPFPYAKDQAVFTWKYYSSSAKAERMNQELWTRLKNKMTVAVARDDMIDKNLLLPIGTARFIYSQTTDPSRWVKATEAEAPIWGDHHTRIHGVYTGDPSLAPNDWYL